MGGLSESAVIMVVVATGLGKTLHRSPRNAEGFRIKRRVFRLVQPDGGLLVVVVMRNCIPVTFNTRETAMSSD